MYKRDEDGFLLANCCHLQLEVDEPYVFLAKMQQVFFYEEPNQPDWKVVLHKEPRLRQVVLETTNETIVVLDNKIRTKVPLELLDPPSNMALVGAIELSGDDAILAVQTLQRPSDDDKDESVS
jgi:hypothetical protein